MRSLEVTVGIQEKIRASLGGDLPDLSAIKVFEATAISTAPVRKRGTLWDQAVVSRTTMVEMAEFVNKAGYVPMHTLHQQGSELPVGRVFHAQVVDDSLTGSSELRVLFYLEGDDELSKSIETGVLEYLSIGMLPKQMICSECDFDYLGDDATFDNLFDRVCDEGHQLGVNGTHIRAVGLDRWFELSLVSVGASTDATIKSRAKQMFSEDERQALVASGRPAESILLVATYEGDPTMTTEEILARLEAQASDLTTAKASLTAAEAARDEATAKLAAAEARVLELEGQNRHEDLEAKLAEAVKTAETAEAAAASHLEFMQAQAIKALVASGQNDPKAPETIEDCQSAIEEAKLSLHQTLSIEGSSITSDTTESKASQASFSAFKSRDS